MTGNIEKPTAFELTVLLVPIFIVFLLCGVYFYPSIKLKSTWKNKTTPLSEKTVIDICEKFSIPSSNKLCNLKSDVYGPDFFPYIKNFFIPNENTFSSFEEVENKLGKYQTNCGEVIYQKDGLEYFSCYYDLNGDGVYPIYAKFYSDEKLKLYNRIED